MPCRSAKSGKIKHWGIRCKRSRLKINKSGESCERGSNRSGKIKINLNRLESGRSDVEDAGSRINTRQDQIGSRDQIKIWGVRSKPPDRGWCQPSRCLIGMLQQGATDQASLGQNLSTAPTRVNKLPGKVGYYCMYAHKARTSSW